MSWWYLGSQFGDNMSFDERMLKSLKKHVWSTRSSYQTWQKLTKRHKILNRNCNFSLLHKCCCSYLETSKSALTFQNKSQQSLSTFAIFVSVCSSYTQPNINCTDWVWHYYGHDITEAGRIINMYRHMPMLIST